MSGGRSSKRNLHLGLRIIKTGIAVTLCVALCDLLQLHQPFVAVVTASISMGRSMDNSARTCKDYLLAAVMGAVLGALAYHTSPGNAGLCGLGIICVIYLCQLLRLRHGALMGSFLFAMVMLHPGTASTVQTVSWCLLAALLGIAVALTVNLLILPPNYVQKILDQDATIYHTLVSASQACEDRVAPPDLDAIQMQLHRLERDVRLYVTEWKLFHNCDETVAVIARRLVTYHEIVADLWAIDRLNKNLTSETATVFAYHLNRANELLKSANPEQNEKAENVC